MRASIAVTVTLAIAPWLSVSAHDHAVSFTPPYLGLLEAPSVEEPRQAPGGTLPLEPARTISFETDTGTWLSLDLAPDGREIVFDLLGDLYALDAQGGNARALTRGLAFDSQPVFSPDGTRIAFLSDRSGAENLWVMARDGSDARQVSFHDGYDMLISPAWSTDGKELYVSRHRADFNAYELWRYTLDGKDELVIPVRESPEQPRDQWRSTLGAAPSPDGKYLYFAEHRGPIDSDSVPSWTITRRDLSDGTEETVVWAPSSPHPDLSGGTAFRPALTPDGRTLVYATRHDGRTGLRKLDLQTREESWLVYPVQQDQLQAFPSSGLLPRYDFNADGNTLFLSRDGKIESIDLASGRASPIEFRASVNLDVGPKLRVAIEQETGPVRARLIQAPSQSPDGRRLAFSALGSLYVMNLERGARPRRLIDDSAPQFQPSWSPDGRTLTYVTWTAREGGHVWTVSADGRSAPKRISTTPGFFTQPVFTPDGRSILALHSSNAQRMASYMEYGSLRRAELVKLPVNGGVPETIASGQMGGRPHFGPDAGSVYLNLDDGLNRIALDGSGQQAVLRVVGPGWYFNHGPASVDDLLISPDGRFALAQIAQQLHLLAMPAVPDEDEVEPIDLSRPRVAHRKLTDIGADFFEWTDGGRTIAWAVGSTWHRRSLAEVALDAPDTARSDAANARGSIQTFEAVVEVPRDVPRGTLVLRGATAITMRGDEVIEDADVVIVDNRIAGVGKRGEVTVPAGATIRELSGRFIVPGLIDAHDHLADVRRGVLDFESFGPLANLAYGVTTSFDPSPLSIDMLAYEDLIDAGMMTGARIHSTGPALFSFNTFRSKREIASVLERYARHYRTRNLKQYRVGNRRVRQWFAQAAAELGMMPTTEGALSMKLNLTQILDGFSGIEHALPAMPLGRDVIELLSRSAVSYTPTLLIGNGGPPAQDFFVAGARLHEDEKLNRFVPHYVIDLKTLSREWRDPLLYAFARVAASAAKVIEAGGVVAAGSHGEMPGLGLHWEIQALASGGLSPMEALHTATLGSATAIGREAQIGSLEAGKFADLIVLERNPLEDVSHTLAIDLVMKNGRLYEGDTLDELWPRKRPLPRRWYREHSPSPASGGGLGRGHYGTTPSPAHPEAAQPSALHPPPPACARSR